MTNPYFSICIETYNRGGTIRRALESIKSQTFKDFEVIIVDDASSDETVSEIKDFFETEEMSCMFKENKTRLGGVKNWNRPLEFAKGKYIAVLEGDDEFLPNHLKKAHEVLERFNDLGIYAVGNHRRERKIAGLFEGEEYFRFIYKVDEVPTPSETIFVREKNGIPYRYNTDDYTYCPEVDLYLKIVSDGFRAYQSVDREVIRGRGNNRDKGYSWYYFSDRFGVIESYKNHPWSGGKAYKSAIELQSRRVFNAYLKAKAIRAGNPEELFEKYKKHVKSVFPIIYYRYVILKVVADFLFAMNAAIVLKKVKDFLGEDANR